MRVRVKQLPDSKPVGLFLSGIVVGVALVVSRSASFL